MASRSGWHQSVLEGHLYSLGLTSSRGAVSEGGRTVQPEGGVHLGAMKGVPGLSIAGTD